MDIINVSALTYESVVVSGATGDAGGWFCRSSGAARASNRSAPPPSRQNSWRGASKARSGVPLAGANQRCLLLAGMKAVAVLRCMHATARRFDSAANSRLAERGCSLSRSPAAVAAAPPTDSSPRRQTETICFTLHSLRKQVLAFHGDHTKTKNNVFWIRCQAGPNSSGQPTTILIIVTRRRRAAAARPRAAASPPGA